MKFTKIEIKSGFYSRNGDLNMWCEGLDFNEWEEKQYMDIG